MKKITNIAILFAGIASLTSCLKGNKENLDPQGSPAVVEWSTTLVTAPTETNGGFTLYQLGYPVQPTVNMDLYVNYAGSEPTSSDVTVNLGVSAAALATFNAAYNTTHSLPATNVPFEILPTALYTMPSSVVIPAGQRTVKITVALKTVNFDFSKAYILPVAITSTTAGAVSKNYGTIMLNVGAQNKYDGVYKLVGRLSNVTDRPTLNTTTDFTWPGDGAIEMRTSSANTIDLYDGYYNWGGGLSQWTTPIGTPTGFSAFGSTRPRFTFNETTNVITAVTNMFPNPPNGRAFALDPTYNSTYNPTTKVIDVRFIMTQPGFQPLTIKYTLTYVHSR